MYKPWGLYHRKYLTKCDSFILIFISAAIAAAAPALWFGSSHVFLYMDLLGLLAMSVANQGSSMKLPRYIENTRSIILPVISANPRIPS